MGYADKFTIAGTVVQLRDSDAVHEEDMSSAVISALEDEDVVTAFKELIKDTVETDSIVKEVIREVVYESDYPVGSVKITLTNTNPSTYLPGTWSRIAEGKTLFGYDPTDDDFNDLDTNNGAKTVTLETRHMPAHTHSVTGGAHSHTYSHANSGTFKEDGDATQHTDISSYSTRNTSSTAHTHTVSSVGGGQAHNNLPPYMVCYIWARIA